MLCYLCGRDIGDDFSRDHVPPQQLWSPEIRRQFNVSGLITLPTHSDCNQSFKLDEEYTFRALATTAYDQSATARSFMEHNFAKVARGTGVGLHRKLLSAMDSRPSGLYLPGDKGVMRIEGARIKRVLWKIIRGLWFLEYDRVLPEDTRFMCEIHEPHNKRKSELGEYWNIVRSQTSRGKYQAVFAHKYFRFEENGEALHGWAMLLWNGLIVYCMHFDPDAPPVAIANRAT